MTGLLKAEESVSLSVIKKLGGFYYLSEKKFFIFLDNSEVIRFIKTSLADLAVYFENSSLKKCVNIDIVLNFLNGSKLVYYLSAIFTRMSKIYANCFSGSIIRHALADIRNSFFSMPVRTGGFIAAVSLAINILLSFAFNQELNFLNLLVKGLLLFLGTAGLSCYVSWEGVKKSSIIVNKLFG